MKVTAIHLAPGRRLPVKYVASAQAEAGKGWWAIATTAAATAT